MRKTQYIITVLISLVLLLTLSNTALADTVAINVKPIGIGTLAIFNVANTPEPTGVELGDIYDFHVELEQGHILGAISIDGWPGSYEKNIAKWWTRTNPIKPHNSSIFIVVIKGQVKPHGKWFTTNQTGNILDSGTF
ncbi:MAG: hypothetical protein ACE5J3_10445 [Methanosarcinales archaeon]